MIEGWVRPWHWSRSEKVVLKPEMASATPIIIITSGRAFHWFSIVTNCLPPPLSLLRFTPRLAAHYIVISSLPLSRTVLSSTISTHIKRLQWNSFLLLGGRCWQENIYQPEIDQSSILPFCNIIWIWIFQEAR